MVSDMVGIVTSPRKGGTVLGAFIDALTWRQVLDLLHCWSSERTGRYICICNAHSLVTARLDHGFGAVVRGADIATPDGAPVAWMLRRVGYPTQQRINGPDLFWKYCAELNEQESEKGVFLYGGTQEVLDLLVDRLVREFPKLKISGAISPPFRKLTPEEELFYVDEINRSGAGTVWVSLGCPKQEFWMAEHREKIRAVMVGVGAAFDYHAGAISRAPEWMRNYGLEWLHRLHSEPKRLWKRYLVTNTLFVLFATRQLIDRKFRKC